MIDKKLLNALNKIAKGYEASETVSEYCVNGDGETVKTKEKTKIKHIPPDVAAIRLLISLSKTDKTRAEKMNDKELIEETEKVIMLMKRKDKNFL